MVARSKLGGAILKGEPIDVYNQGRMKRDFTYIDDIVEGVIRTTDRVAAPDPEFDGMRPNPGTSQAPCRVYNIGNNKPVNLLRYIETIENAIGKKANKRLLPMQPADVLETYADIDDLEQAVQFRPRTALEEGVGKYVAWFRDYYQI